MSEPANGAPPPLQKITVSERALFARLKRHLAKEGEYLRKCPQQSRWFNELGEYYTVNLSSNFITAKHISLEQWARECGVLKGYEELAEEV
jgi:hypothetical protein